MRLRLALLQGVVSIHASFDVATQIKHMQAKKSSAESIALLESVVQSRVLHKKIGEELSLSNPNTSALGAKRKI